MIGLKQFRLVEYTAYSGVGWAGWGRVNRLGLVLVKFLPLCVTKKFCISLDNVALRDQSYRRSSVLGVKSLCLGSTRPRSS